MNPRRFERVVLDYLGSLPAGESVEPFIIEVKQDLTRLRLRSAIQQMLLYRARTGAARCIIACTASENLSPVLPEAEALGIEVLILPESALDL